MNRFQSSEISARRRITSYNVCYTKLLRCETFFDNVVVPQENLVGPLHGGWTLAKALLGHERTQIAAVGESRRIIRKVKRIAAETGAGGKALLDDPALTRRQKAAIIVRVLLSEGGTLGLSDLPQEMQVALTREIGARNNFV